MKENTVFHFGNSEVKFTCYRVLQSVGKFRLIDGTRGTTQKRARYFLACTLAGQRQAKHCRINVGDVARWEQGFDSAGEMMEWATALFASKSAKKSWSVRLQKSFPADNPELREVCDE